MIVLRGWRGDATQCIDADKQRVLVQVSAHQHGDGLVVATGQRAFYRVLRQYFGAVVGVYPGAVGQALLPREDFLHAEGAQARRIRALVEGGTAELFRDVQGYLCGQVGAALYDGFVEQACSER